MPFILLFLFILAASTDSSLINFLAPYSDYLQNLCQNRLAQTQSWSSVYQSMVCATPFPKSDIYQASLKLNLVHCLVVSGAHLFWLTRGLELFLSRHLWTLIPCLFIFLLLTNFQAPVARAFLFWVISAFNQKWQWHWSPPYTLLITAMAALALHPPWLTSLSFSLSWAASCALTLKISNPLLKTLTLTAITLPLCLSLNVPHLAGLILSILLAPPTFIILLSTSWWAFLSPSLSGLTEPFLEALKTTLIMFSSLSGSTRLPIELSPAHQSLYAYTLNLILILRYRLCQNIYQS